MQRLGPPGTSRKWERVAQAADEAEAQRLALVARRRPPWSGFVCYRWVVLSAGETPVKAFRTPKRPTTALTDEPVAPPPAARTRHRRR